MTEATHSGYPAYSLGFPGQTAKGRGVSQRLWENGIKKSQLPDRACLNKAEIEAGRRNSKGKNGFSSPPAGTFRISIGRRLKRSPDNGIMAYYRDTVGNWRGNGICLSSKFAAPAEKTDAAAQLLYGKVLQLLSADLAGRTRSWPTTEFMKAEQFRYGSRKNYGCT